MSVNQQPCYQEKHGHQLHQKYPETLLVRYEATETVHQVNPNLFDWYIENRYQEHKFGLLAPHP